ALDNFKTEMPDEEKKNLVQKAIEVVGLNFNEVKDKSPFELSGGQKRRVAIAGAIVSMPEVLILDEPVAGLDPKGKEDFLSLLHKLHSKFVKTIVIITHDMDIASEHCSSLAVFSDGKILKKGTPQEVFSDEELLLQAGLELPLTAYLQKQLKNNGIIIDSNLTVDDFIAKCLSYKKEGK
ncbi:MAG: ATP-binding cassette domain-containing protein, partial [Clostridia bacterium]|nr:ATP-binding cassette domain-containing protein [Clostridia bacterium]